MSNHELLSSYDLVDIVVYPGQTFISVGCYPEGLLHNITLWGFNFSFLFSEFGQELHYTPEGLFVSLQICD
jgi:hypothetical protein